jgi:hypothetical protein
MSLHEETQQIVILKRGKTARVSFADNEAIENVKYIKINDTNFKKLINLNQNIQLDKTKKNDIILQPKNESELVKSFDEICLKSSQDKIKKKKLQDAEIYEIENKARIKSAMNKKRKKSVETEKLKIEEIIRKRFNQNESYRNKVKLTEKLPKMIFTNESNNTNGDNENSISKSVYLPLLRYNKHENDLPLYKTHLLDKIKLHDPSSRSSQANYEEDRIKADGGLKIINNIKEKTNETKKLIKFSKNNSLEIRLLENESDSKRIAEETTRKIAEIKAQKVYFLI